MDAQLRFSARIAKEKKAATNAANASNNKKSKSGPPMKAMIDTIDLPLSSEMREMLYSKLHEVDEDGYPTEATSSVLATVLDSEVIFCPTSALINSNLSSIRGPPPTIKAQTIDALTRARFEHSNASMASTIMSNSNDNDGEGDDKLNLTLSAESTDSSSSFQFNNSLSTQSTSMFNSSISGISKTISHIKIPTLSDAASRLNILWLQRKAMIEKEEGRLDDSYKTLQQAIDEHVGTTDYSKANLGDHMISANATELLEQLETKYLLYDLKAHTFASRIQRFTHRRYTRRCLMETRLAKVYRGHVARKSYNTIMFRRIQCCLLIQRRFRTYLDLLQLKAFKVQRWYRGRKSKAEYYRLIREYRLARRIQRLARGNYGRVLAANARHERNMIMLINLTTRGYISRKLRPCGIVQYHKMFHYAALMIQRKIRCVLCIKRAQVQLLNELAREDDRMDRENNIIDNTIKVEIDRVRLYIKSYPGRLHQKYVINKLIAKDKQFKLIKHTMSPREISARDALIAFELFDTDGSGQIDEDELSDMLRELCIPMTDEEVHQLSIDMDDDGSGDIDFGEFMKWYVGEAAEDAGNASLQEQMLKQVLRARSIIMEISGVTNMKRSERDILRQCTVWKSKDIASTFRLIHAPKFQCCKCMQPFTLFTDYWEHFDLNNGYCSVLNERALYYTTFWNRTQWSYQKQCEIESLRYVDELHTINYVTYMSWHNDYAIQQDTAIQAVMNKYIRAAHIIYLEKMAPHLFHRPDAMPVVTDADRKSVGMMILDIVKLYCNDNVPLVLSNIIATTLGIALPIDWVADDVCTVVQMEAWLLDVVDHSPIIIKKSWYTFTDTQKVKKDALLVATIYIKCIRCMQVGSEAALVGLIEFRLKRPRKLCIPDSELRSVGLDHLTEEVYLLKRDMIIEKLAILTKEVQKVLLVEVPTCCGFGKKASRYIQIGTDGNLTPDAVSKLLIDDAHTNAYARYTNRLASPIGVTQVKRWSKEQWASKKLLHDNSSSNKQDIDNHYFYQRYACKATDDGIDAWDIELVENALSIHSTLKTDTEILEQIDPDGTGMIKYQYFDRWLSSKKYNQYVSNTYYIYNSIKAGVLTLAMSSYQEHAKEAIHTNFRILARLELELRSKSILAIHANESLVTATDDAMKAKCQRKCNKLKADIDSIQDKMTLIRDIDDNSELLLLYRMTEDEAKTKCEQSFFSSYGIYSILTERQVILAADKMIEAYGYLLAPAATFPWYATTYKYKGVPSASIDSVTVSGATATAAPSSDADGGSSAVGNGGIIATATTGDTSSGQNALTEVPWYGKPYEIGWHIALEILVHAFDTDCSGTFDEGEVSLLLHCARCKLSERQVLHRFPEVRLASATMDDVVAYLITKVGWRRGILGMLGSNGKLTIARKSSLSVAVMMLISLSRQIAREKAEEATTLSRTGKLMEEDGMKTDSALIMRSQMFAMRQVYYYIKTSYGEMQLKYIHIHVKKWWYQCVVSSNYSITGLIDYACRIHSEEEHGMIVTELPHLIKFLVTRLKLKTNSNVSQLQHMLSSVKNKEDLYWLNATEICELIERMIVPLDQRLHHRVLHRCMINSNRLWDDAIAKMYSNARQQAIMISMCYDDIKAADTNYRCSILALDRVIKEKHINTLKVRKGKKVRKIDWSNVPREALSMLLVAKGYMFKDLMLGNIPEYVAVYHDDGAVCADPVPMKEVNQAVYNSCKAGLSRLQMIHRWGKCLSFVGIHRYFEYKRVVKALTWYSDDVDVLGASFLKEITNGTSHCIKDE